MTNKWRFAYFAIKEAEFGNEKLLLMFRNGDRVTLSPDRLAPDDHSDYRWSDAKVSDDGLHVVIPGKNTPLEIPADFIRRLTDAAFANHSAKLAERQARLIGQRLRELREKRGLSQIELARRAGIQQANLSRIENAHFDVATSTLWKLLAVMGYEPADLSTRSDITVAPRARAR